MSRILLADDSPHAQRMGERILREEGFEVVTVTDGQTALMRLADVDPDLVLADVSLPGRSGYEICKEIKNHPRFKHVRVILTAGLLERFDEAEAQAAGYDGVLKKPFEATLVLNTVRPLVESAVTDRPEAFPDDLPPLTSPIVPIRVLSEKAVEPLDAERVRAAVTLALDAALPSLIEEITTRVLTALESAQKANA